MPDKESVHPELCELPSFSNENIERYPVLRNSVEPDKSLKRRTEAE
jgi:hypothetical protein